MATLDLYGNYAEQILSLYLWDQITPPDPSELADDKWIRPYDATITVGVDASSYMATAGSNLSLANQKMFQLFFNNEYRTGGKVELSDIAKVGIQNGNEIILNHKQFVGLFYGKLNQDDLEQAKIYNSATKAELNLYNYTTNTDSEDYWQRSFTFGSTKFQLDTASVKYVFDATTGKALRLDDVKVQPLSTYKDDKGKTVTENFDFESNQDEAGFVNSILKKIMDPSGIGRKVNIEFTGNGYFSLPSGLSYTQEDYRSYIAKYSKSMAGGYASYPEEPTKQPVNWVAFRNGLEKLQKSGIYDFLDENGKIVIYGSENNDFITEFNAKNFSLDSKVTAYGMPIPNWLLFNTFEKHLKKGITYIGGKDNDIISGTDYDDYIYGNDDRDDLRGQKGNDTLIGGTDADTLYGGDGDDILIGGLNEKDVKDDNAQNELHGEAGDDILKGSGRLEGGEGFDRYYAYDTAVVSDEDGKGEVYLAIQDTEILLTGGTRTSRTDDTLYKSSDGSIRYVWDKTANTLTINDTLTLENWQNGELGIRLGVGQDIAFIIDVSGSMQDDMQAIVDSIDKVTDALFYATPASQDNRIAVATYETNTTILQKFTNHETAEGRASAFKEAMAKVPPMVQGGVEHVYQAIYDVLIGKAGAWRQDADTRTIFVFGDEPGDDRHLKPMVDSLANNLGYTVNNFTRSATRSVGGASLASYRIALDARTSNDTSENLTSQNSPLSVVVNTISIGNNSLDDLVNQTNNTSYHSAGVQDIVDVLVLALNDLTMSLDNVITVNSKNDVLHGRHGNDKLYGDNGDNVLNGDSGDDILRGGNGNDTLNGGQGNDILEGQEDNDTLYGNQGDDILYGNDGNDTLDGNEGNDVLYGGDGDDVLTDTSGTNTLVGGRGYDVYHIHGTTNTRINDKDGMIYVDGNLTYIPWGSWGNNNGTGYHGMSAYESFKLAEYGKFLYKVGEVGHYQFSNNHDRLGKFIYDSDSQTLVYQIDRWQYPKSPYGIDGKAYTDNYFTITNFDINQMDNLSIYVDDVDLNLTREHNYYHGTKFSLSDFISQGDFEAYYSDADDVISDIAGAGFGNKIIYAKDGNDVINLNDNALKFKHHSDGQKSVSHVGFVSVYAGNGDDVVTNTGHNPYVKIYGEAGNDTIQAAFSNQIDAGEGDDTVHLDYGNVYGGNGNDIITIHKGTADGGLGDDLITVINNPKTTHLPYHTYDNIKLIGGDGSDTLTGGNGNDWLQGDSGADTLIGGLGDDTYIVDEFDTYLEEGKDLEGGYDTIHIASSFDLSANNFEAITLLGNGDFSVVGDEFDNQIIGNTGNNHLMGGAGTDTLNGGDGNDHLNGGTGTDLLDGGLGNDYYVVDNELDNVVEQFDGGIDTVEQHIDRPFYGFDELGNATKTGSYNLLFNDVENLILKGETTKAFGNHLDNIITLNNKDNFVNALAGNDTIIYQKGGGRDTIASMDSLQSKDSLVIQGYDLSQASFVRVTNTASTHDMLQIRFKGSNDQITLLDYFADEVAGYDNRIDQITFTKGDNVTTLSQSQFEAKIFAQTNNHAPWVNKYPKPIKAQIGKILSIQFDKDTIKDMDAYDSELSYRLTLASKGSDGHYEPLPNWLKFDPTTLTLTGTPPKGTIGSLQFILWGEDSFNNSAGAYVNLSVVDTPSNTTTTPKPTNPTTPQANNLVKDTKGNDVLKGDSKDTTFVYTGGKDILTDAGGNDILVFSNGITFNQVGSGLMQSGNDLILRVNGSTTNQMTLKNFFGSADNIIETIRFETGGQIDYKKIYSLFGKTLPTDTPTPIIDTATTPATPSVSPQNSFIGTSKADKLNGTDHHDQLQGLAGADTLDGKAGQDILIGGTGNDKLIGGTGNDLYYFAKGFGKDTIVNTGGGYDNIYFDGISFNQVGKGLTKMNNDLILKVSQSTDELTIKNFFTAGDNADINISFADGGSISATQLLGLFKSTKAATHTDIDGFNKALDVSLALMQDFKTLTTEGGTTVI